MLGRIAPLTACAALCLGAGGAAPRVTLTAPATAVAGLPVGVTVRAVPVPASPVVVHASAGARRVKATARGSGDVRRATLRLPFPGSWRLSARIGRDGYGGPSIRVAAARPALPLSVALTGGVVHVGDAGNGRLLRYARSGALVHAVGLGEPTGLTPAPAGGLYVADFLGRVLRVSASGRVTVVARVPEVTSVASRGELLYAVTMPGELVRIAGGRVTAIPVPGGLDRPHGVAVDRDGTLLVAEDSRRVRRIDPETGRATLVASGVDTNKIAVGGNGTLYLAGGTRTGGTLRRLEPGGEPRTIVDGLRVADVAVLPDGDLVLAAIEPARILRADPRTGALSDYR